jgi:hypothetical protein
MLRRVSSNSKNCAKREQAYRDGFQTSDLITEQTSIFTSEQNFVRQQASDKTIVKPLSYRALRCANVHTQSFVE